MADGQNGPRNGLESRMSRVETSVARLTATVESLVAEWNIERNELRSAIGDLRAGSQTRWKDIIPWATLVLAFATMGAALVTREIGHLEKAQQADREYMRLRFDRNENVFLTDHNEVIRNTERWRLFEEGLLVGLAERRGARE